MRVKEIIQTVKEGEYRKAVYSTVIDFLKRFVSTDTFKPEQGIQAPHICGELIVPESYIEDVIAELEKKINGIDSEVSELTGLEVGKEKNVKSKKKAARKNKTSNRKTVRSKSKRGPV